MEIYTREQNTNQHTRVSLYYYSFLQFSIILHDIIWLDLTPNQKEWYFSSLFFCCFSFVFYSRFLLLLLLFIVSSLRWSFIHFRFLYVREHASFVWNGIVVNIKNYLYHSNCNISTWIRKNVILKRVIYCYCDVTWWLLACFDGCNSTGVFDVVHRKKIYKTFKR